MFIVHSSCLVFGAINRILSKKEAQGQALLTCSSQDTVRRQKPHLLYFNLVFLLNTMGGIYGWGLVLVGGVWGFPGRKGRYGQSAQNALRGSGCVSSKTRKSELEEKYFLQGSDKLKVT